MEKNLKKENKEIMDEVSKTPKAVRVSNPIAKNKTPKELDKKKTPAKNKKISIAEKSEILPIKPAVTDPLERESGIVARINNFTLNKSSNKMYSGYLTNSLSAGKIVDYSELIQYLNTSLQNKKTTHDLFTVLHNVFVEKLNCIFTAFGE